MHDVSVFLVDDHELFLSGVRAELAQQFTIAGSANTVDDAIDGAERIRRVVLDLTAFARSAPSTSTAAISTETVSRKPSSPW